MNRTELAVEGDKDEKESAPIISKFQLVLASVVTTAWIASLIVRVAIPGTSTQFGNLDMVVLLVYGFIFGMGAIRKSGVK